MADSMEEIIKNDPHVKKFIPGENRGYEINFGYFGEAAEMVEEVLSVVNDWMASPYIVDDFVNHSERREWRDALEKDNGRKVGQYLEQNVLRKNRFNGLINSAFLIKSAYPGSNKEVIGLMTDIENQGVFVRKEYDALTVQEKIDYVVGIKQRVHNLLSTLEVETI
jgi:hypothetical protein